MGLRLRLFIAFALLSGASLYFALDIVIEELEPAMRQSVEETLIDTSIMLAEAALVDFQSGSFKKGRLAKALTQYDAAKPDALIWGIRKQRTDHRVYVTDARGIVIYDSDRGRAVGQDYSRWNDVYLTLRGQYGARSSKEGRGNESVMYVAAPIVDAKGSILGVLSVGKPADSLRPYFRKTRDKIIQAAALLFAAALTVALLLAWWHGRDVAKIAAYADQAARGIPTPLPPLSSGEMRRLGRAVETMRTELEGKEYVETYVHSLTHELKSPLTAINGAVEILSSPDLEDTDRRRFLRHIETESGRIRRIIDRLLDLAALEKQQILKEYNPMDPASQLRELIKARESTITEAAITIRDDMPAHMITHGEPFLIKQALDNLLSNALDFTPPGGTITLSGSGDDTQCTLTIRNTGDPIPDFALNRLFERFYSLPRPQSGAKGTGLGLPFVREVALLHGGSVRLDNTPDGVTAMLTLAVRPAMGG